MATEPRGPRLDPGRIPSVERTPRSLAYGAAVMTRTRLLIAVLALALPLSACATTPGTTQGATSGASADAGADAGARSTPGAQPEEVNDVDLHFLGMMTPHHEQAVEMSDIVLAADGVTETTRDLALRIKTGQQDEIDTMVAWATDWDELALLEMHSVHIANGMLEPEQMDALAALTGPDVERRFLEEMRAHHVGAIAMTEDQVANGGYGELRDLAQQMIDVQTAEVAEMDALLA